MTEDSELEQIRAKRLEELKNSHMPHEIIHITEENFNDIIKQNDKIVIDFWAEWCGPCRMFAPVFEKVSLEYPDVQFCKCNTDENQQIARELMISAIPTIMYIKSGSLVKREAGLRPEAILRKELDSVFR